MSVRKPTTNSKGSRLRSDTLTNLLISGTYNIFYRGPFQSGGFSFDIKSRSNSVVGAFQILPDRGKRSGFASAGMRLKTSSGSEYGVGQQSQWQPLADKLGPRISGNGKEVAMALMEPTISRNQAATLMEPTISRNQAATLMEPTISRNQAAALMEPTISRNQAATLMEPTISRNEIAALMEPTISR